MGDGKCLRPCRSAMLYDRYTASLARLTVRWSARSPRSQAAARSVVSGATKPGSWPKAAASAASSAKGSGCSGWGRAASWSPTANTTCAVQPPSSAGGQIGTAACCGLPSGWINAWADRSNSAASAGVRGVPSAARSASDWCKNASKRAQWRRSSATAHGSSTAAVCAQQRSSRPR